MCTLTFIPKPEGFILTHNRDESRTREPAMPPQLCEVHGKNIIFPKDGRAGGTWMACSSDMALCLLNGAFQKHSHTPPYRLSRGIVLLDVFAFGNADDFRLRYDLNGIEPFTLVCVEGKNRRLCEIRWDGNQAYYAELPFKPAIWSSTTLYDAEARSQKEEVFENFLNALPDPEAKDMMRFQTYAKTDKEDFVMQRPNGVQTLSIAQVIASPSTCFLYHDLVLQTEHTLCF